jgi:hypothetical protein
MYRQINVTLLLLTAYLLSLPLIDSVAKLAVPGLWQCAYKGLFNQPCPLCHITRDVDALMHGSVSAVENPLTLPIVMCACVQAFSRSALLFKSELTGKSVLAIESGIAVICMVAIGYHVLAP